MSSALLYRWTAHNTADGTLFFPPEGKLVAGIHVRERLRPLERLREIVKLAEMQLAPNVAITKSGAIEMIQTHEGEYGALVSIAGAGRTHGQPMGYTIGFVCGDDFYDRIDAYYNDSPNVAEYQALVREYVLGYRLNLGDFRSRRFYYDPPTGWQGRARGMLAQWFSFDYPKRVSQLIVPASFTNTKIEASVMARSIIQRRLIAFKQETETLDRIPHPGGFETNLHHVHGSFGNESTVTDLLTAVATDQYYVYVVRLETMTEWLERDREALLALTRSIQPIPHRVVAEKYSMSWMVE